MEIQQYGNMVYISFLRNICYLIRTDGENTIIGVGDSGLDTHSCFFYDENVPVIFSRTKTNGHRKIAK